ncbi:MULTISPECIES: hypothetical protein [unclassified Amycolatopsis]|uniref:hypothetical protein n=1 Tax=unclassified Amycolatopsis TaxID=2618356 RepID=UPI0034527809
MSARTGHENTTLLVLRGPSGSGKTTVAEAVRSAYGHGLALVQFAVPFEETVARHATRRQAQEFTPEDMRSWYVADDQLGVPGETTIPAGWSLADTLQQLHHHLPVASPSSPPGVERDS